MVMMLIVLLRVVVLVGCDVVGGDGCKCNGGNGDGSYDASRL